MASPDQSFEDKRSLTKQGKRLFLIFSLSLLPLVAGVYLIVLETVDYYPHRAMQEREVDDETTDFLLDDYAVLKSINKSLQGGDEVPAATGERLKSLLSCAKVLTGNLAVFTSKHFKWLHFWEQNDDYRKNLESSLKTTIAALNKSAETAGQAFAQANLASRAALEHANAPARRQARLRASALRAFSQAGSSYLTVLSQQAVSHYPSEMAARERYLGMTAVAVLSFFGLVLLVVFGGLFVYKLLTRLRVLSDNCYRFLVNQPLHEPLGGYDDIAALDRAFHAMNESLKSSAQIERLMMQQSVDLICSLDRRGKITSASRACENVLGYSEEELIGARLVDYVDPKSQETFVAKLKEVTDTGTPLSFEIPIRDRYDRIVELLFSVSWSSKQESALCITHDISEIRQAERVQQELVQMVSHDLRSPLTSVSIFHELVQAGMMGQFDAASLEQMAAAQMSTGQMITLVSDLLEIARLDSGMLEITKEPCSLKETVESAIEAVSDDARAKSISIYFAPADATVICDQARIEQVLTKLLTNAIRSSRAAGRISITAESQPDRDKISVTDEAGGLPEESLSTIFERYHLLGNSDPAKPKGLGLALSICHSLIKCHGGEIWVENRPGIGSTFSFTLPREKRDAAKSAYDDRAPGFPEARLRRTQNQAGDSTGGDGKP